LQTGDYVEPSFDVIEPVLIEHPKLQYPEEAKRQKIPEAVVRVRVLVDHTGAVQEAEVVKGAGHGFDEVALAAAAQAKFIPATKGRVQVKTWTVLPLVFRLED
jgi:protein TonB